MKLDLSILRAILHYSHSTLAGCSTVIDRHWTKLQNGHSLCRSFYPADCLKMKGHSETQQDDSDLESLLVLRIGEGTSAGFAVVMETSDHSIEAGHAAFAVLALRVVLTILHKHIIITTVVFIFLINFCKCTLLVSYSFYNPTQSWCFHFPVSLQQTIMCLCMAMCVFHEDGFVCGFIVLA